VLSEQANLLLKSTENKVGATILNSTDKNGKFVINFFITSPALPNYSFKVFSIAFSHTIFPLNFTCDENIKEELQSYHIISGLSCNNYDDFIEILSAILGSDYVSQVISSVRMMASTNFSH